MKMPKIVYIQTTTRCNGHCVYCPFDDVYADQPVVEMKADDWLRIGMWLAGHKYEGRISFGLHYEPLDDPRLLTMVQGYRDALPRCRIELITQGHGSEYDYDDIVLRRNVFDHVTRVLPGSKERATSRAGNVSECSEIEGRLRLMEPPCTIPVDTMCIAANGNVLLCCQDWRHEAVVGNVADLDGARQMQLACAAVVRDQGYEICQDCMAGKTAEEVGDRLCKRRLTA